MPKRKGARGAGPYREIEQLRKRRLRAQDNGDIAEESKLCNAIGELYAQLGEYTEAIRYHQFELALSEASGDRQGAGIAHRKIGECECELQNYSAALEHQSQHLKIARKMGDLVEEQRALATLGRTHLVHSQAMLEAGGGGEAQSLLTRAGKEFLNSLDVCDRLAGAIPETEVLQMRSRLYLNLGLVYESKPDLSSARKFMEKALSIVKDLGDQETTFRCHYDLGSLHLQERHPALALASFQCALSVARETKDPLLEGEALGEVAQAHMQLGNFEPAKACLKKVLKLPRVGDTDVSLIESQLKTVRKIVHYSAAVGKAGVEDARERLRLLDKLGDLACGVRAFPAAVKYYSKQLGVAEAHGLEPAELRPIYNSLARTHSDCGQYSQALLYYGKELELWTGSPTEECDTLVSMAKVHKAAGHSSQAVLEAYNRAVDLAEQSGNTQKQVVLYGVVAQYCQGAGLDGEAGRWRAKLEGLLAAHPGLVQREEEEEGEEEEEEEDSSDAPLSLSSQDSEDDDETPKQMEILPAVRSRRRKVDKRNEKGETLLQVAAIEGNLSMVKQLLAQGADVNSRDHCGWLPLHEACNHGHLEVVATLLEAGAAINDSGCNGITPLIDAATNGHFDIVQLLVDKGADISKKDKDGRTALGVVEERLFSRAELGLAYQLEEEHRAIRDFLTAEMLRKGVALDHSTMQSTARQQETKSKNISSVVRFDRTGTTVLDSSDEEDTIGARERPLRHKHKPLSDNPFQSFTVGPVRDHPQPSRPSASMSQPASTSRDSQQPYMYNPLGQVEGPALIPEEDSCSRGEESSCETDSHPVVDDWLIDDIGRPPAKRAKHTSDPPTEEHAASSSGVSSFGTRRTTGGSARTCTSSGRSKLRQSKLSVQSRVKKKSVRFREHSANSTILIESDFEEQVPDDLMDTDFLHGDTSVVFGSSVATPTHSTIDSTQSRLPPPQSFQPQQQLEPPLRVKVKIEGKSYLIPCPRQWEGTDTTVSWLMAQATERYYSQHGVRPQLSLTTLDGALLCSSDVVSHLLQDNEEVVGVVEQWHLPPLSEGYQTACKNNGVGVNSKILRLLETSGSSASLDLSSCTVCPRDSAPLFQALSGQHSLSTLVLSGNRLRDGSLAHLSSSLCSLHELRVLDLSCAGLTAEGIEALTKGFPPPSTAASANLPLSGLHSLSLSHNQLGGASGLGLARLLRQCTALRELKLDSCDLTSACFESHAGLTIAIQELSSVTGVSVALNPLGSRGVLLLLQALRFQPLTRLSLSGTCERASNSSSRSSIGAALSAFRESGSNIEWLDLSHCGLRSCDVDTLRALSALQVVNLAGNAFTHHDLGLLCSLLSSMDTLCAVDLSGNPGLGNAGTLELLRACSQRSHKLKQLNLAACGLAPPMPDELAALLSELQVSQDTELDIFTGSALDDCCFPV